MEGKIPQLPLDKENKLKEESRKAWGKGIFGRFFSWIVFLGKGRRKMMSFNRWWKKKEWIKCL